MSGGDEPAVATVWSDKERAFVAAFESCELANEAFRHRDHVHLAWLYLGCEPLLRAIERFVSGLKRFAAHHGAPDLYHETITWAFLLLIQDRRGRAGGGGTFAEFELRNPDLFAKDVLKRFYRQETLGSKLARRSFVFPDRIGDGQTARLG